MSGTGGEDGDIARRDLDFVTRIAAEPDPRMAAIAEATLARLIEGP